MSENSGELQRRTAVSVEPASGIGDTFGPKTAAPQRTPMTPDAADLPDFDDGRTRQTRS